MAALKLSHCATIAFANAVLPLQQDNVSRSVPCIDAMHSIHVVTEAVDAKVLAQQCTMFWSVHNARWTGNDLLSMLGGAMDCVYVPRKELSGMCGVKS